MEGVSSVGRLCLVLQESLKDEGVCAVWFLPVLCSRSGTRQPWDLSVISKECSCFKKPFYFNRRFSTGVSAPAFVFVKISVHKQQGF